MHVHTHMHAQNYRCMTQTGLHSNPWLPCMQSYLGHTTNLSSKGGIVHAVCGFMLIIARRWMTNTHTCIRTHSYTHTHMSCTHTHTNTYTCTHTHTHVHTHTVSQTYIYIYTHVTHFTHINI
jgi:hypothetical protein